MYETVYLRPVPGLRKFGWNWKMMYLVYSVYSYTVLSHFQIHSEYIRIHHEYTCDVSDIFSNYGIQANRHKIHQIHWLWNPFLFSFESRRCQNSNTYVRVSITGFIIVFLMVNDSFSVEFCQNIASNSSLWILYLNRIIPNWSAW